MSNSLNKWLLLPCSLFLNDRSTFHDQIRGTTFWPELYDGRAIISQSYKDHLSGMSIDENKTKLGEAERAGDASRQVTWAYVEPNRARCSHNC